MVRPATSAEPLIAPALLRRSVRTETAPGGNAWLRKGFRPFFALAAAYGALIIPLWLLILNGLVRVPGLRDPLLWHAHEMLFGYTTAVVAGFLLTAVGRWSGKETAVGGPLLALAVLWLLGRVAMLSPFVPLGLAALLDAAFLPALAFAVGRPLILARNRRNYGILGVILLLALANVGTHLDAFGVGGWARQSYLFALDLMVLLMVVVGARVIPMFTRNALGDSSVRSDVLWDRAAL
ncbi:MAG TPA: NnrS family protein, partial [Polyangiaceae bacterium]|nr:NnrS family protein [Polyangiaceae bacterium]